MSMKLGPKRIVAAVDTAEMAVASGRIAGERKDKRLANALRARTCLEIHRDAFETEFGRKLGCFQPRWAQRQFPQMPVQHPYSHNRGAEG